MSRVKWNVHEYPDTILCVLKFGKFCRDDAGICAAEASTWFNSLGTSI